MTESSENSQLESGFALLRPAVQWTLMTIATLALAAMLLSGNLPLRRPADPADAGAGSPLTDSPAGLTIDLNTAEARELALLPGVGPVLARRIVADRNQRGRFDSLEELGRVHGIGEKTIAGLRPIAQVRP